MSQSSSNSQHLRPPIKNVFTPPATSSSPAFSSNMQPPAQGPLTKPPPPPSSFPAPTSHPSSNPSHGASLKTGIGMNGPSLAPPIAGSMGPPSRPAEKDRDKATDIRTLEDPLAGTGVNLDEEERNLTNANFLAQQGPRDTNAALEGANLGPLGGGGDGSSVNATERHALPEETAEANQQKEQALAEFQAARWAQNPLWNAFLLGDPVEKKLNSCAYENGIESPTDGLFLATKGTAKPQTTQVVGHDGATQIIDRGQTILSTESGDALGDIMKLVSLATKDRVTGLLDHSGRLACERRDHSAGRVPIEWKTRAMTPAHPTPVSPPGEGAVATKGLKRTFSQIEEEQPPSMPHKIISVFHKVSGVVRDAEKARLVKRAKRANAQVAEAGSGSSGAATPSGAQTPSAAPREPEKRLSKKDRKAVQDKMSDVLQQKSANETARMAMGLGASSKFKKKYSWLNSGGATAASPSSSVGGTPLRSSSTAPASGPSTAGGLAPRASLPSGPRLGDWKESDDVGIQARDVLMVLETDGKAVKALFKAYNTPENPEKQTSVVPR